MMLKLALQAGIALNSLAMYTLLEKDEEFRDLIIRSLEGHLEFMPGTQSRGGLCTYANTYPHLE